MSASLTQAIDDLRTMRESYDSLIESSVALSPDVAQGKTALATAITGKGVTTSATDSLATMADKVALISQGTYEIDGGEMYAKQLFGSLETPNYWNLYEVLEMLLSDGRLSTYGGILLAEYYKGYDSLALAGAGAGGAYVVSDKDSQGNFIMYTNDTTHVWDTAFDGKGNRWVAYCFADAGHDFQITDTNTSPRSIHIGRSVGKITCLVASRVSEIVVTDGNSLAGFDTGTYAANWGATAIVRNLQSQSGILLYSAFNTEKIYVSADTIAGTILNTNASTTTSLLRSLIVECKHANNAGLWKQSHNGNSNNLSYLCVKGIESGSLSIGAPNGDFSYLQSLKTIYLEQVEGGSIYLYAGYNGGSAIQKIEITYKTNDRTKTLMVHSQYQTGSRFSNLTDVDIQDGWCKPLTLSYIDYLTEENIVNHILNKLGDNTGQSPLTITLGATNLAKLTAEEIAIATNKGFTLA